MSSPRPTLGRVAAKTGVTLEQIRPFAMSLPRTSEHLIRDRVKFRVKQIVYLAFSRDETVMGFGFPREEREALVDSRGDVFMYPSPGDMRYQWVHARMDKLTWDEAQELILDAWAMCVPKFLYAERLESMRLRSLD